MVVHVHSVVHGQKFCFLFCSVCWLVRASSFASSSCLDVHDLELDTHRLNSLKLWAKQMSSPLSCNQEFFPHHQKLPVSRFHYLQRPHEYQRVPAFIRTHAMSQKRLRNIITMVISVRCVIMRNIYFISSIFLPFAVSQACISLLIRKRKRNQSSKDGKTSPSLSVSRRLIHLRGNWHRRCCEAAKGSCPDDFLALQLLLILGSDSSWLSGPREGPLLHDIHVHIESAK